MAESGDQHESADRRRRETDDDHAGAGDDRAEHQGGSESTTSGDTEGDRAADHPARTDGGVQDPSARLARPEQLEGHQHEQHVERADQQHPTAEQPHEQPKVGVSNGHAEACEQGSRSVVTLGDLGRCLNVRLGFLTGRRRSRDVDRRDPNPRRQDRGEPERDGAGDHDRGRCRERQDGGGAEGTDEHPAPSKTAVSPFAPVSSSGVSASEGSSAPWAGRVIVIADEDKHASP